jgi:hypothetical protein
MAETAGSFGKPYTDTHLRWIQRIGLEWPTYEGRGSRLSFAGGTGRESIGSWGKPLRQDNVLCGPEAELRCEDRFE